MERWNEWLRRRIRMYIWKQWKQPRTRVENLKKLGMPDWMAYRNGNTRKGYWAIAGSGILSHTITNERLARRGYYDISEAYKSLHCLSGYISIHPLRGEWDSKTAQKNMQFLYKANNVTDSVCVLCAYDRETSKNFVHLFTLFCANLPGILCSLMVRIRQPKSLPLHTTFSLRNAQPLFDSDSRDNKIAGYLCLYP